jgi:uncharacterized protein (DUF1684 family)
MKIIVKACLAFYLSASCFFLILSSDLVVSSLMADEPVGIISQTHSHQQAIEAWRASRHERLMQPDGWLTLVGLEWLLEGETSIGSAAQSDIQLPGGPDHWGVVVLQKNHLHFKNLDLEKVSVNNTPLASADLVADTEGEPTVLSSGNISLTIIFRESYALRIKDSQAKALKNFKGVENYPISESWCIDGEFIPAAEGAVMEITNVLGQLYESPVFGTFEFDMDGKTHSLIGLGEKDSENLWFIFADRTTGHGTYGAGRYLYSDGLPENGRLTVDFNKAYNPPCAFNPYSTCPIPPQRNRMDLLVLAGEKDFHPDSD